MIDLKLLERDQEYLARYKKCIADRKGDPALVDGVLERNQERKKLIAEVESNKAEQNRVGQLIVRHMWAEGLSSKPRPSFGWRKWRPTMSVNSSSSTCTFGSNASPSISLCRKRCE